MDKVTQLKIIAALAMITLAQTSIAGVKPDRLIHNTMQTPSNLASNFNATIDGKQVKLFELKNKRGMTAYITNYGGRLVSLLVPDKHGKMTDVVQGFTDVKGYQKSTEPYLELLSAVMVIAFRMANL